MIVKIFGIEECLEVKNGEVGLINVHNKTLYKKLLSFMVNDLDTAENNEVVFLEEEQRLNSKHIEYIHDIYLYSFNSKTIIDFITKRLKENMNFDYSLKEKINKKYMDLIEPLIKETNLLEIDYDYNESVDVSLYSKMSGLSFKCNDELEPLEKCISLIKTNIKLLNKKCFIFNGIVRILNAYEIKELIDFCRKADVKLLLFDYIEDADVVIGNNICIDEEYGVYTAK